MAVITVVVQAYKLPLGDCNVFFQAPSADYVVAVDGVQNPGAIIGLEHGNYTSIENDGLRGAAGNEIKVIPLADTGRLVVRDPGPDTRALADCQHVIIDGSGIPGETYGFLFNDRFHIRDQAGDTSSDLEVNNVMIDISAVTNQIGLKVTPNTSHRISGIKLHDIWARSEASTPFYIGNPHWNSHQGDEEIENVEIYDNIVTDSESGIELKACVAGGSIHDNVITFVDPAANPNQGPAISFQEGTAGVIYNNTITDCEGGGIATNSNVAGQDIYNNLIVRVGQSDPVSDDGIRVGSGANGTGVQIYNNTIVTVSGNYGIDISGFVADAEAWNNVILNCATGSIDQGGSPGGNFHDNDVQESGHTIANYDFVDAAGDDYHLEVTSPGKNSGTNAPTSPATDLDGNARDPVTPSKGCYE